MQPKGLMAASQSRLKRFQATVPLETTSASGAAEDDSIKTKSHTTYPTRAALGNVSVVPD
ncbi:uncharacterized protein SETTUDRAFT_166575 [Exserohilum turcica Et28A]|uniref:Uncharacterized protein n=1 Tax=Exserohilum turcicum (strain 28A) TaxID=671987 RepID=R0J0Y0_EXST2|nr:uncharacterized protein SETTUDRAFT_166575 [Exserohilum turcica Et28A]EOA90600.1 hypothetical protein SETTUDRAFT_166575 [Exserohilum turcica Et28A]